MRDIVDTNLHAYDAAEVLGLFGAPFCTIRRNGPIGKVLKYFPKSITNCWEVGKSGVETWFVGLMLNQMVDNVDYGARQWVLVKSVGLQSVLGGR